MLGHSPITFISLGPFLYTQTLKSNNCGSTIRPSKTKFGKT